MYKETFVVKLKIMANKSYAVFKKYNESFLLTVLCLATISLEILIKKVFTN